MLRRRRCHPVFSPGLLFAGGVVGAWFDPSDISTLFQDTAGTTPITAAGQTVALMRDKSGNGFHATQATAAKRPTYQVATNGLGVLGFDGVDDSMATAAIPAGADKATLVIGQRKISNAVTGAIAETGVGAANGSFALFALSAGSYQASLRGTVPVSIQSAVRSPPDAAVLAAQGDISGDSTILRVNGAQVAQSSSDLGTGNYGSFALNIGMRNAASFPYSGDLHGMILRFSSSMLDASLLAQAEAWMNFRTGAY